MFPLPPIPIADSFLAGSILSLLMPVLLLIGLVTWYLVAVRHVGGSRSDKAEPVAAVVDSDSGAAGPPAAASGAGAPAGTAGGSGPAGGGGTSAGG